MSTPRYSGFAKRSHRDLATIFNAPSLVDQEVKSKYGAVGTDSEGMRVQEVLRIAPSMECNLEAEL